MVTARIADGPEAVDVKIQKPSIVDMTERVIVEILSRGLFDDVSGISVHWCCKTQVCLSSFAALKRAFPGFKAKPEKEKGYMRYTVEFAGIDWVATETMSEPQANSVTL